LTAEQILSRELNADLVVLSACNSGRGIPTESGILGLPFAFGLAGVPRVVVSQWSVPDASTRLLMINYYNAMRENIRLHGEANPPGALRKAMLDTKNFPSYQDPIYWAGFTTIDVSY
jgi:CHAT domain-containing protein